MGGRLAASKDQATTITMYSQPWRSDQEYTVKSQIFIAKTDPAATTVFEQKIFICLVKLKTTLNFKVEFFMDETVKSMVFIPTAYW